MKFARILTSFVWVFLVVVLLQSSVASAYAQSPSPSGTEFQVTNVGDAVADAWCRALTLFSQKCPTRSATQTPRPAIILGDGLTLNYMQKNLAQLTKLIVPSVLTGAKGDRGPQGEQGEIGPQGPRGFTGATGAKGDTGANGSAGNVTAGDGLSSSGDSSSLTLHVSVGNGVQIVSDAVTLKLISGGGLETSSSGLSLLTSCSTSQILKWNGTSWVCSTDSGGSSYTADGEGIELTGTEFGLELNGSTLSKSSSGLALNLTAANSWSGIQTFTNGFTLNSNTFTDLVGTGLSFVTGTLSTTLGTSVTLTSEVTGVLPIANGGSNKALTLVPGGILYTDSDSFEVTSAGSSSECLLSGGAGTPTWGSCGSANYWQLDGTGKIISPGNSTWDLVVGGTATSSAKFQIFGLTGSATSSGNLTLAGGTTALNTIAARNSVGLFLGDSQTGNVVFNQNGNVGVGDTTPTALFTVGSGDLFRVDSTGSITASAGVTTTGDISVTSTNPRLFYFDSTSGDDDFLTFVDADTYAIQNNSTGVTYISLAPSTLAIGNNTDTKNIRIGGVTASGDDNVSISTNGTAADDIAIGNTNAATTFSYSSKNSALTTAALMSIGTNTALAPLYISHGNGSNAALIVDQLNTADIFVASAAGTTKVTIDNTGRLGVGITPSYALHVKAYTGDDVAKFEGSAGGTACTLSGTTGILACTSDQRLKKDIGLVDTALEKVLALRPVDYHWNFETGNAALHTGFIAQQVEEIFPTLVSVDKESGYKQLSIIGLVPYLTRAIQEQQSQIGLTNEKMQALKELVLTSEEKALLSQAASGSSTLQTNLDEFSTLKNSLTNLLSKIQVTAQKLVFGAASEFQKPVIFHDVTEFMGNLRLNGTLTQTRDAAGYAVIEQGTTSVRVTFEKPFASTPIVVVSPKSIVAASGYIVSGESPEGFTIEMSALQAGRVEFSWSVTLVDQPRTAYSTTLPSASPFSTPTASVSGEVSGVATSSGIVE